MWSRTTVRNPEPLAHPRFEVDTARTLEHRRRREAYVGAAIIFAAFAVVYLCSLTFVYIEGDDAQGWRITRWVAASSWRLHTTRTIRCSMRC
jgi:hypothetical protein